VEPLANRAGSWGEQTDAMSVRLSIGDFSRMTHLSIKALRRYHDMGLLVPANIDRFTAYRYYDAGQVPIGQVIRRFRDLGMPLEQVKEVLQAGDATSRNELIVAHLRHMESELAQTQQTVSSLRALLEKPLAPMAVEYRYVASTPAMAIAEPVAVADIEGWWVGAFDELRHALESAGAARTGPDAALYPSEFFEDELGEVVAYVPVSGRPGGSGRVQLVEIPGAELAVTLHQGAFSELDQAYGALGTFVAEREIGVQGPIREHYLVGFADTEDEALHRTEVCWPVFHTKRT
jgi:DNA-binding transcriptional MerR regulator